MKVGCPFWTNEDQGQLTAINTIHRRAMQTHNAKHPSSRLHQVVQLEPGSRRWWPVDKMIFRWLQDIPFNQTRKSKSQSPHFHTGVEPACCRPAVWQDMVWGTVCVEWIDKLCKFWQTLLAMRLSEMCQPCQTCPRQFGRLDRICGLLGNQTW